MARCCMLSGRIAPITEGFDFCSQVELYAIKCTHLDWEYTISYDEPT